MAGQWVKAGSGQMRTPGTLDGLGGIGGSGGAAGAVAAGTAGVLAGTAGALVAASAASRPDARIMTSRQLMPSNADLILAPAASMAGPPQRTSLQDYGKGRIS